MNNAVATANTIRSLAAADDDILSDEKLWQVVSSGDLKGLSASQKSAYYLHRCRVEGLNPASQPFQYLTLQGKEILYATRSAADQLRKLHRISIVSVQCVEDGEYITYEVRVRDPDGREDFEIGSVFAGTVKGAERSNARMKALTKAKRRATYSICGTGALDETEVGDIVTASEQPDPTYASLPSTQTASAFQVDQDTGEIIDVEPEPRITRSQATEIVTLKKSMGWDSEFVRTLANQTVGKEDAAQLTEEEADALLDVMRAEQDKELQAGLAS